jgi:hypothetical protein
MKKILLILAIAFSSASFGQGNLQFNQVVNLSYSHSGTGKVNVGSITIPAGKVWKVTSASALGNNDPTTQVAIYVGNHVAFANYSNGDLANYQSVPLWLNVGSFDVYLWSNSTVARLGSLSVLEFNVVP